MKKTTFLALLLAGNSMGVHAQDEKRSEFSPYWSMQIQGGAAHTLGEIAFKKMLSPSAAIYAGYQFTPLWGLRAGLSGWQGKGSWVTPQYDYSFNFIQVNIDATLNLGNLFGGYKATRIVNPYLFAGAALNGGFNNDDAIAWNSQGHNLEYLWSGKELFPAGRFGLGADFRLTRNLSFNLEANANVLSDKFNSKKAGNADWHFNLIAGFSIKLGGKKKAEPAQEIIASQEATPATPATPTTPVETPKEEQKIIKTEQVTENVFFKINSASVSKEGMDKINRIVDFMKANANTKVNVCGYADKQTGNSNYNKTLSKKRAEAVSKLLESKGISKERIITDYKGDSVQPFSNNAENRVVICITKE